MTRRVDLDYGSGGDSVSIPIASGWEGGISLLTAGDMALSKRATQPWRSAFFAARGFPPERTLGLHQVHSRNVVVIEGQSAEDCARVDADGMVTDRADPVLTVTVADCLPLLVADRQSGAFAIVHSGWRGTGIVLEALRLMATRFGTDAADCVVTIGPGIGSCCYEVPEERAAAFEADFGAGAVVREAGRAPRLDLRAANVALLEEAGVGEITVVDDCTRCAERLGSFRRQGPERYTLMLAWIRRA
ncbi:MAG TPA: polyphenol oxidase family protein [Spirochaetia bacterium]